MQHDCFCLLLLALWFSHGANISNNLWYEVCYCCLAHNMLLADWVRRKQKSWKKFSQSWLFMVKPGCPVMLIMWDCSHIERKNQWNEPTRLAIVCSLMCLNMNIAGNEIMHSAFAPIKSVRIRRKHNSFALNSTVIACGITRCHSGKTGGTQDHQSHHQERGNHLHVEPGQEIYLCP